MPAKGTPGKVPDPADKIAYGGYLITTAGCVECHSKTDDKGGVIAGTEFGGGMEFKMPGAILRSPNITPDQTTGIGNWTEAAFVSRFRQYADSNYHPPVVGKSEFNTPMPWLMFGKMKPQDLAAIYAYLKTVKPIQHKVMRYEPAVAMK
jgi:mono/diheme cytochrome c family protein